MNSYSTLEEACAALANFLGWEEPFMSMPFTANEDGCTLKSWTLHGCIADKYASVRSMRIEQLENGKFRIRPAP